MGPMARVSSLAKSRSPRAEGIACLGHARTELQIPAGTEVAMRAMEHGHARGRVIVEGKKGPVQGLCGGAVHRVCAPRAGSGVITQMPSSLSMFTEAMSGVEVKPEGLSIGG